MQRQPAALPQVLSTFLVLLASGCITSQPVPPLTKSQFYAKCSDWSAMIKRSIPDKTLAVENEAPSKEEGVHGRRLHHRSGLSCDVRASKEDMDKLMQSLRADLRKTAGQMGVEIDEEAEGAAVEGFLGHFEIQYTAGAAHGKITVSADSAKPDPNKPAEKIFPLHAEIEEWVR